MTHLHRRVIVCGGRDYSDLEKVREHIVGLVPNTSTIVHGGAPGADSLAALVATEQGYEVQAWPADWSLHGRAAGPIRNKAMIDAGADFVIAFPGGRGTGDCVSRAEKAGIPVVVVR